MRPPLALAQMWLLSSGWKQSPRNPSVTARLQVSQAWARRRLAHERLIWEQVGLAQDRRKVKGDFLMVDQPVCTF